MAYKVTLRRRFFLVVNRYVTRHIPQGIKCKLGFHLRSSHSTGGWKFYHCCTKDKVDPDQMHTYGAEAKWWRIRPSGDW